MSMEYINSFTLIFHIVIIASKLSLVYFIINKIGFTTTPKNTKMIIYSYSNIFMLFLTIIYIISELNFIYVFYDNLHMYLYEYMAMTDQIILTILVIFNIIKGDKNGNKN